MSNYILAAVQLLQKKACQTSSLGIVSIGLMLWASHGVADTWQHTVTARISAEHETNPAMTPVSRGSIRRALLVPEYTLARTEGPNEWRAGASLLVARSSDTALSMNREDPSVFFNWLRRNQTGEFGVSAKYDEAATRISESGTTGPVAVDGTRASRALSANWNKPLTERTIFAADGSYTDITYKGGAYQDYVTRSGSLRLTHDWNESISPFLAVSYIDQTPTGNGLRSRQTRSMLGINFRASERLDGSLQAGRSRGSGANYYHTSQYGLTVQYTGQVSRLSLRAERQTYPSGLGSLVNAEQVNGEWSYELGERTSAGANAGWRKNRSLSDETTHMMSIWLQRYLDASWAVRMHLQRRTREIGGLNASSNIVGILLSYSRSNF